MTVPQSPTIPSDTLQSPSFLLTSSSIMSKLWVLKRLLYLLTRGASEPCPLYRGLIFFWRTIVHRFTILVDAGYLLRQAAEILSGKTPKTARADITITDPQGLIEMLVQEASTALQNVNLLRVYWYDGVKTTLTAEHKSIMALPDVQFRAGTVNGAGQQKGVDSRIVTDLVELAGHHAVCDALLVTGDGDLAIGIELAQRRGVRVAVLGVEDMTVGVHHSQSPEVVHVADRVARIGRANLAPYIKYTPRAPMVAKVAAVAVPKAAQPAVAQVGAKAGQAKPALAVAAAPAPAVQAPQVKPALDATAQQAIEKAVDDYIKQCVPPLAKSVVSATGSIDHTVDRGLLLGVAAAQQVKLLDHLEKNYARAVFRARATTFA
jgi:uncharacterized LabA/DUF88 family protein